MECLGSQNASVQIGVYNLKLYKYKTCYIILGCIIRSMTHDQWSKYTTLTLPTYMVAVHR
jgi:hypothetical protein